MPEQSVPAGPPLPEQSNPEPVCTTGAAQPDRPLLNAAEALARLRAGQPLTQVRVRRLWLKGEFPETVEFQHCTLEELIIDGAVFRKDLLFRRCTLDRLRIAKKTTVEGQLALNGCHLRGAAFSRLTVKGPALFGHARFHDKARFQNCCFAGRSNWWEARFHNWVDFVGCEFANEADFRSVDCDEGLIFLRCTFRGPALFRGAAVHKKFQTDACHFDGLLDLSKAKLHDFAYLETITTGPQMRLALINAVTERLLVRPAQVEGRLLSEQEGRFADAMQEYGLLKRCYQAQHRFAEEDWAYYHFKVCQRRAVPRSWRRPGTKLRQFCDWLFLDQGCGYGTNPARAVGMAGVIILAFALVYMLDIEDFYDDRRPFPEADLTHPANRVMMALTTSVSVFTSGMGGIREIAKGWLNVPIMIESLLGTLLFGLFIVAFSRKVIR